MCNRAVLLLSRSIQLSAKESPKENRLEAKEFVLEGVLTISNGKLFALNSAMKLANQKPKIIAYFISLNLLIMYQILKSSAVLAMATIKNTE
jgi:hypothetical protein|tara:strand:+ start:1141 stop:1416 length:276 start_codon:yes stop_codon:yes gene_type:complete